MEVASYLTRSLSTDLPDGLCLATERSKCVHHIPTTGSWWRTIENAHQTVSLRKSNSRRECSMHFPVITRSAVSRENSYVGVVHVKPSTM